MMFILIFLIFLIELLIQSKVSCSNVIRQLSISCSISNETYNALYTFYNSTNGNNWRTNCKSNWNFQSNNSQPCSEQNPWYGITCNHHCQITELNLPFCNLQGTIPTDLGNLTNMTYFYLSFNSLTGTIPTELGNMKNTNDFLLNSNNLTGTIPTEFGNMKNMTYFDLDTNKLTGTIPIELGNMKNMTVFNLYTNNITGNTLSYDRIQSMTKTYKTHRNIF